MGFIERLLDYGVEVPWVEDRSMNGAGYYCIDNWGMIDRSKALASAIKAYGLREAHSATNEIRKEIGMESLGV